RRRRGILGARRNRAVLLRTRPASLHCRPRVRQARPSPDQLAAADLEETEMIHQGLSRDAEKDMPRVFGRARAILCAVMLAVPSAVWAQSSLPDLSLEDLMKLDGGQVYGASERLQPVTEAPSSVSFITAEEIARFGYRTLADILRGVRGMYVTDDRNFSLIGTRGFAKPGDYNGRILLLINGHRVNDNVFGQAEIGAEFG